MAVHKSPMNRDREHVQTGQDLLNSLMFPATHSRCHQTTLPLALDLAQEMRTQMRGLQAVPAHLGRDVARWECEVSAVCSPSASARTSCAPASEGALPVSSSSHSLDAI